LRIVKKAVKISKHARKRMEKYGLHHHGRKIAHKFMNDRVLRVIYEENDAITIVTVYPARRERYAKAL